MSTSFGCITQSHRHADLIIWLF